MQTAKHYIEWELPEIEAQEKFYKA
nr:hypothetical protein [Colwellia demingiae]